jgi:TFIIF-interacting CTD phosphatase-like protein
MPKSNEKKQYVPATIRNIILDLDETLISAFELPEYKKSTWKQDEFRRRGEAFQVHQMGDEYMIVERPHVQDFLDFVFKHYNVSVWTAASKDYAIFILRKIVLRPGRKLDLFLFAENTDDSYNKTGCLKQLNQLFHLPRFTALNTMLVDDNKNVSESQNNHVWRMKKFNFFHKGSEHDEYLVYLLDEMKNVLTNKK